MQRSNPVVDSFYHSREWKKARTIFIKMRFGLCERCGGIGKIVHHKKYISAENVNDESITLNFENLELLCQECHNREHFEEECEFYFDDDGNVLKKAN